MSAPKKEQKLKEAERLRRERKGIFKLFSSVDYIRSGEIFQELGEDEEDENKKKEYLLEAAKTYEEYKGEYGHFRSYEMYKILAEIAEKEGNSKEYIGFLEKQGEQLRLAGRNLLAGQTYARLGNKKAEENPSEALDCYKRAIDAFNAEGGCKYHKKEVFEHILEIQLTTGDIKGVFDTLANVEVKYKELCRHLLGLMLNIDVDTELASAEEKVLFRTVLNQSPEVGIRALDSFESDNYLPSLPSKIFKLLRNYFLTNDDIC